MTTMLVPNLCENISLLVTVSFSVLLCYSNNDSLILISFNGLFGYPILRNIIIPQASLVILSIHIFGMKNTIFQVISQ